MTLDSKLDPKIVEAVQDAVAQATPAQTAALSDKIIAWMSEVTAGNENVQDDQTSQSRLEMLFKSVTLPEVSLEQQGQGGGS